jgi:hypothetical protein
MRPYLCHLSQGAAFLPEINHDTATAVLRLLNGLLNTKDQVGAARANVRPEHIATVALMQVNIVGPKVLQRLTSS